MPRPKKHPESLVRLQPYLLPLTASWLVAEYHRTSRPIGEILDELIAERMIAPSAPEWMPPKSSTKTKAVPAKRVVAPVEHNPTFRHEMVRHPNPNLGKWCANCHMLERAAAANPNCPGAPE
jgi:hypothetical protein